MLVTNARADARGFCHCHWISYLTEATSEEIDSRSADCRTWNDSASKAVL